MPSPTAIDTNKLAELPMAQLRALLTAAQRNCSDESPLTETLQAAIEARSGQQVCATMTEQEVADRLGVSTRQVQRLRARGEVPAAKRFGQRVRFLRAVIDAWFDDECPDVGVTGWTYQDYKARQRHPNLNLQVRRRA